MDILNIYNKCLRFPFGRQVFNIAIGIYAPFFSKIKPKTVQLEQGLCVVEMSDRRSVRNHIGSVNAGALCTLVELAGGLAVDVTLPSNLRWLPKGMHINYLKKANGTLKATCRLTPKQIQLGDVIAPVLIHNSKDEPVVTAEITFYISEKKRQS